MSTQAALSRFALLTQLPALASLEEKSRALAEAAYATVASSNATVVIFGRDRCDYASAPPETGPRLHALARGSGRAFFAALERFGTGGVYVVSHDACEALAPLTDYRPAGVLLILPLETPGSSLGALLIDANEPPRDEELRELRTFADIAAWMIAHEREMSAAEREAEQSALLALINERARRSLDRQAILESLVEDIRASYRAVRCVVYGRDPADRERARVLAAAERGAKAGVPKSISLQDTWLERAFAGGVVSRERISLENPQDALLRGLQVGSALMVPMLIDGSVDHAIAVHFDAPDAFDEIDVVMLRSVASHVGLALANVQFYDLERLRRARAESLERVVRMLRDTQTIEEVMLVFAVTVSHEVKLTCAAYEIEGTTALRRAVRAVDSARDGFPERVDFQRSLTLLEADDILLTGALPPHLRETLFGQNEGLLASLRIDGNLWGFIALAGAPGMHDWSDSERRVYFHMLGSHLELALSGAIGFERIQQLARALSESNEFKDDLLAMLAHDFKGPLTVILGYCELLLESAPEAMRDELETIYAQTKRLVRLSEDAVALAQTQAGGFPLDRSATDLRSVVAASVKAHNRGDDRIRLIAPAEPIEVALDVARFNHVLDNLLMNALKYSQDEVLVRLSAGDANASIAVSDSGIGIPAAELGTVFARFGRASNARRKGISGSGVGLYVSRKIAELHGGSIAVQSKEGEGSTFTVTLPLSPARAGAGQP